MKKLPLLLFLLFPGVIVLAQSGSVRILTFSGFTFEDQVNFSNGYGKVSDGFQWGVGLEFGLSPENAVEVFYQQIDTRGIAVPASGTRQEADLRVSYIMIGGTRFVPVSSVTSIFGSLDVGASVISPTGNTDETNITKFAWGVRGGAHIKASRPLSFRIYGQLLSPVQAVGSGFYFGTDGSGIGTPTNTSIFQFNLGGSLLIRLK